MEEQKRPFCFALPSDALNGFWAEIVTYALNGFFGTETVVDAVKLKYKVASQMVFSFVELFVNEKFNFLSHEHVVTNF